MTRGKQDPRQARLRFDSRFSSVFFSGSLQIPTFWIGLLSFSTGKQLVAFFFFFCLPFGELECV